MEEISLDIYINRDVSEKLLLGKCAIHNNSRQMSEVASTVLQEFIYLPSRVFTKLLLNFRVRQKIDVALLSYKSILDFEPAYPYPDAAQSPGHDS